MRWTIHAIAAGAAMISFALPVSRARASTMETGEGLDDDPPAPLVDRHAAPELSEVPDEAPVFVWSSDFAPTPPPYVIAATGDHFVPSNVSSTAIPLPPAVWTGFASLGALGTISLLKRRRHRH